MWFRFVLSSIELNFEPTTPRVNKLKGAQIINKKITAKIFCGGSRKVSQGPYTVAKFSIVLLYMRNSTEFEKKAHLAGTIFWVLLIIYSHEQLTSDEQKT